MTKTKISFFDAQITLQNGILSDDQFDKPTDSHKLLDTTSCHPKIYCKKRLIANHESLISWIVGY